MKFNKTLDIISYNAKKYMNIELRPSLDGKALLIKDVAFDLPMTYVIIQNEEVNFEKRIEKAKVAGGKDTVWFATEPSGCEKQYWFKAFSTLEGYIIKDDKKLPCLIVQPYFDSDKEDFKKFASFKIDTFLIGYVMMNLKMRINK